MTFARFSVGSAGKGGAMQNRLRVRAEQIRPTFIAIAVAATLAICLPGYSALARPGKTEILPDLRKAWDDYNRATIGKDIAMLATLVTDDYMLVNSDGSVQDKASYLADFRLPGFKLEPYKIEQPLQKSWGDAALTGGVFNLRWTQDGTHNRRRLRIAHVWTKQDGRWRISYTQLTRVPE
jgi:ketosteroid isomerase-like protein